MMKYKSMGLKKIVYGFKEIPNSDIRQFLENYRMISKMSRGQEENFEKLADEIEKGTTFLGCVGVKDNVRKDARPLISKLQKAEIGVSMLTGDNIEKALVVAKELRISESDFNDSSQFFNISFHTEEQGYMQIKRILETIYEQTKVQQVLKVSKMTSNHPNKSNKLIRRSSLYASNNSKKKAGISESFDVESKIKKTLLIDGPSSEIISESEMLRNQFTYLLRYCDSIIGYSLDSNNKAFIVRCIKTST